MPSYVSVLAAGATARCVPMPGSSGTDDRSLERLNCIPSYAYPGCAAKATPRLPSAADSLSATVSSSLGAGLSAYRLERRESVRNYSAFGGILRADIEFPELPLARDGAAPDWRFVVNREPPPPIDLVPLGERAVGAERFRLWQSSKGLRLQYSHAGTFDLWGDGSEIVWYHDPDAVLELVRSVVLGPAIALAFELAGSFCLHGSAVCVGGRATAFVGPKHFGKSTLASALTLAGARLLGDDLLVVNPGPPAVVRPGVASVRLWADMANALPLATVSDTLIPGVKTTVAGFADNTLASGQCLLATVYVLSPAASGQSERPVWRTRLAFSEAAISLAHQTKLSDSLVGLRGAGAQLAMAAAVATTVRVWRLHVERDVSKLDAVVRQIIDWSSEE